MTEHEFSSLLFQVRTQPEESVAALDLEFRRDAFIKVDGAVASENLFKVAAFCEIEKSTDQAKRTELSVKY